MKMLSKNKPVALLTGAVLLGVVSTGCHHVDDNRTPPAPVWIVFATQASWEMYGVPGALDHRRFIKDEGIPSKAFFTATSQTGFGGVLLVGDVMGTPLAYDLSCPVENSATIRVKIDEETNDAYCEKCGSRYSVFTNYGTPTGGPAAKLGYGLTKYLVGTGANGEYRVITR